MGTGRARRETPDCGHRGPLDGTGMLVFAALAIFAIAWGSSERPDLAAALPDGGPPVSAMASSATPAAAAPVPAAPKSPTAYQKAVAACLEAAGLPDSTALSDAETPSLHGTALDRCRAQAYDAELGIAPPKPAPAAATTAPPPTACFTMTTTQLCGPIGAQQHSALPSSVGSAGASCTQGSLVSPVGCAIAAGRVPLSVSRGSAPAGQYFAWLSTGDLFSCPLKAAPTEGAGCQFLWNTPAGPWGLGAYFSASSVSTAASCPAPLTGIVGVSQRVHVTIGLGTASGGYVSEPAMVDTGAPETYIVASQLSGTAWKSTGVPTTIIFPLAVGTVSAQPSSGPLAIRDGSRWVSLGTAAASAMSGPGSSIGDGLGLNALADAEVQTNGSTYTLFFAC